MLPENFHSILGAQSLTVKNTARVHGVIKKMQFQSKKGAAIRHQNNLHKFQYCDEDTKARWEKNNLN